MLLVKLLRKQHASRTHHVMMHSVEYNNHIRTTNNTNKRTDKLLLRAILCSVSNTINDKGGHYVTCKRCYQCLISRDLGAETVDGASLALQGIHDVEGRYSFPVSMLGVGNCVTHNRFQEALEDSPHFGVDEGGDPFDSTSSGQSTNRRLSNASDGILHHLAVSLRASLAESFAAFTSSRHF